MEPLQPKPSKLQAYLRKISANPLKIILFGYASYIIVAVCLLSLPICWKDGPVSFLDNLFIATSAVSTTGLVTVNTPVAYNFWGQLVILIAFQLGGLGYMTVGSFLVLMGNDTLSSFRKQVGSVVFSLPEGFDLKTLIQHTVIFTALAEIAGIFILTPLFSIQGVDNPLWTAIFHTISAFCTAGFSIFPNSLEDFRGDFWINVVVSILSLLGAIGFLVASDVWQSNVKRRRTMSLTSKVILLFTSCFIIAGFVLLLLFDTSIQALPIGERILAAWFQSMTALTTVGFNTHPIASLSAFSVLLTLALMIVGASPSGTGGGIKTTSISAALGGMWSSLRGNQAIAYMGRRIPEERVTAASAAIVFYILVFLIGTGGLLLVQDQVFEDVVFEVASALGTVGLSRGITGDLTVLGKLIVITMMYVGRIGPLSFGMALLYNRSRQLIKMPEEDLAV
ncbi:MAG: potassium transporter TrkG [Cyanobacteria bacterium P01_A01_bin.15]